MNRPLTDTPPPIAAARPTRVLLLAQYPIKTPMHGGQVRARALANAFAQLGCEVASVCVYPDFSFPIEQRGPLDVVISSSEFSDAYFAEPLFGDLAITSFVLGRPTLLSMMVSRIVSFSPDLIWLEQPFLLPIVEAARRESGLKAPLIYSSANNETALKRILIALETAPGSRDHGLVDAVAELERATIEAADFVACINDEEAATLRAAGVRASYLPASSPLDFGDAAPRPAAPNAPRYVAYAASSYWLNVDGYFDMFGDGLGFLTPDQRVAIAGGGADAIKNDRRFERHRAINESRIDFRGFLPADALVEFYLGAAAIIVPVTQGSGSNLKTADALASGRPVISTPKGLAGFRSVVGDALGAGVYEAETPHAFKKLVRAALRGELRGPAPAISRRFRSERMTPLVRGLLEQWGFAPTIETVAVEPPRGAAAEPVRSVQ